MTAALRTSDLSSEMLAFVKAGTPQPVAELSAPPTTTPKEPKPPLSLPVPIEISAEQLDRSPPMAKLKPNRARHPDEPVHKVTLSIRVPSDLTAGLLRASTDRKLNREHPSTQQEIVTEAIEQWLKHNGY